MSIHGYMFFFNNNSDGKTIIGNNIETYVIRSKSSLNKINQCKIYDNSNR